MTKGPLVRLYSQCSPLVNGFAPITIYIKENRGGEGRVDTSRHLVGMTQFSGYLHDSGERI